VNAVVTGYALANPGVAVSLEHDGRETFATEGNGDLRSAVLAVYGREVADAMVDMEWEPGNSDTDSPVHSVTGLVSHPETTRSSREYLATYVNGRYVTAGALRDAVLDAYGGQLAPDRYPFAVLFVEVPPGDVDVNVHPRKLEVRFDEEPAVRAAVEEAVEAALLDHGLIRSTAPRGQSAPDQTEINPEGPETEAIGGAGTDHERAALEDRESGDRAGESRDGNDDSAAGSAADASELDPTDDDAWAVGDVSSDDTADPGGPPADRTGESAGPTAPDGSNSSAGSASDRPSPRSWQSEPDDAEDGTEEGDTGAVAGVEADTEGDAGEAGGLDRFGGSATDDNEDSGATDTSPDPTADASGGRREPTAQPRSTATAQRTLDGEPTSAERTYDSLPPLRVLGQLHETYVIAEAPDGLVLIDQHAADERVNYERLQTAFADGADAQALAEPVRIELTAREAALFEEFVDDLAGSDSEPSARTSARWSSSRSRRCSTPRSIPNSSETCSPRSSATRPRATSR